METEKRIQQLQAMLQQATQEAVMRENMLQGARQKVAEIQGRISELVEIKASQELKKDGKQKKPDTSKAD